MTLQPVNSRNLGLALFAISLEFSACAKSQTKSVSGNVWQPDDIKGEVKVQRQPVTVVNGCVNWQY